MKPDIVFVLQFIRQLAALRRDHTSWIEICALLDELSDQTIVTQLQQIEQALAAWSAAVRLAPQRWVVRLRSEGHEPRVRLCRTLSLAFTDNRDELWRALDADDVSRVTDLILSYCGITDDIAADIARRLARTDVASLNLKGNAIGDGLVYLLSLATSGNLARLDLESCGVGDDQLAKAAAAGASLSGLRDLSVAVNYLTPRGIEALVRFRGFDALERLSLAGNKFLAPGVQALVKATPSARLRGLNLEGTQCGDAGAALLASASPMVSLETLSLTSCYIGDEGAAAIAATTALSSLRELDLHFNGISAVGAGAILGGARLPGLRRLRLDGNPLGEELVDVIASCPQVARLESLWLDDASTDEHGRSALAAMPHLKTVEIVFA